ncbi:MAG TPA: glycoside hydrolase family 97 N-terminal domain-containing protein, partial [Gillisia sp.]|nr:glycoside hydrolase family 97 N-terminal domain-containing protein [Gillisia sp.]
MKLIYFSPALFLFIQFYGCQMSSNEEAINSPNNEIELSFSVSDKGTPSYVIDFNGRRVIDTSYFSFDFKNAKSFGKDLKIAGSYTTS